MDFLILTGMSGAGKSQALKALEDIGFFCVDNLPPALIAKFCEMLLEARSGPQRFAAVVDVRSRGSFDELFAAMDQLKASGVSVKIVFLDAADNILVNRYKETRRRHPLMIEGVNTVAEAIGKERLILSSLREQADYIIDSSMLSASQLREMITRLLDREHGEGLMINCTSFGYKYGLPEDADLVFDVRVLPNPFYNEEMRPKTGLDEEVSHYVLGFPQTQELLSRIMELVLYMLPFYKKEGKSYLVIAIGCTGGHHRSVATAEELAKRLGAQKISAVTNHRDFKK